MKRDPATTCRRWPGCVCGEHWLFYQSAPVDYFLNAEPIINAMLSCIVERCPDARVRSAATIQLLHPIFRRQQRKETANDES